MNFLDDRLPMRFWSRVQPCPMSGCWIWTGSDAHGYGRFRVAGKPQPAHRVALSVLEEIVPELEIDHKCTVRSCVNPAHLHQVTRQVNCALTRQRNKTCRRGHAWTEENTHWQQRGKYLRRDCRQCYREWIKKNEQRKVAGADSQIDDRTAINGGDVGAKQSAT